MKNAIVIGASSGIGKELAIELSKHDYRVCITGRRTEALDTINEEHDNTFLVRHMDITDHDTTRTSLDEICAEIGNIDLIIISSGIGHINPDLDWAKEEETITTNVLGCTFVADYAMTLFERQQHGHLVGFLR